MTTGDIHVRLGNADDLARLEAMWLDLYDIQKKQGMQLRIPEDGFQHWANGLRAVLGRFACLFVVEHGSDLVGFLAGRVRTPPPYFGTMPVGFISEIYVKGECRGIGAGSKLIEEASAWFRDQGITRLELQVLSANHNARHVYQKLGWVEELVQMVLVTEQ
jgi:GNAT superfamily N-acetyltransferase